MFTDIIVTENDIRITVCRQVDNAEFEDEDESAHLFQCIQEEPGAFGVYGRTYEGVVDEDPRVLRIYSHRKHKDILVRARRFRRIY